MNQQYWYDQKKRIAKNSIQKWKPWPDFLFSDLANYQPVNYIINSIL